MMVRHQRPVSGYAYRFGPVTLCARTPVTVICLELAFVAYLKVRQHLLG